MTLAPANWYARYADTTEAWGLTPLEILEDGSIVVTCWDDYSLHLIRDGKQSRIASNVHQPADPGLDTRRKRLLIPSVILGRVEVWQLTR